MDAAPVTFPVPQAPVTVELRCDGCGTELELNQRRQPELADFVVDFVTTHSVCLPLVTA